MRERERGRERERDRDRGRDREREKEREREIIQEREREREAIMDRDREVDRKRVEEREERGRKSGAVGGGENERYGLRSHSNPRSNRENQQGIVYEDGRNSPDVMRPKNKKITVACNFCRCESRFLYPPFRISFHPTILLYP